MQKIHKYITIDEEIRVLWFHIENQNYQLNFPTFILIPKFISYMKLLNHTIRIDNKGKFKLKNISTISECEINFSQKSIKMKSMGQVISLNEINVLQFGEDAGFNDISKFWNFYEEMYKDIILKDDNFTIELLVIYCG